MSLERHFGEDSWSLIENGETILTVQEIAKDGEIRIGLTGKLNNNAEHFFQDELMALASVGMNMKIDFEGLTYIAYSCLMALLSVQHKIDSVQKGDSLTLYNVPEEIYSKMKKYNVHEVLMIAREGEKK